jgi:membrane associated rhomboid family serine protease
VTFFFVIVPFYVPAAFVLLAWFFLQFLTGPDSGVAWDAHVGGFLAGAGLGLLLRTFRPPRQPHGLPPGSPGPRPWSRRPQPPRF